MGTESCVNLSIDRIINILWENNSKRIKNTCIKAQDWHLYLSNLMISGSFKAYIKILKKDVSDGNSWKIVLGVASVNDDKRCTWIGGYNASIGYIGNGQKTSTGGSSIEYGANYDIGDEIVIERTKSNQIIFYKNGINQGVAFEGISGNLYLAVSFSNPNHEVELQKVVLT